MKKVLKSALLVSLLTLTNVAFAQTFTNYTSANGLIDNYVSGGVAIDQSNNKWFATAAGVSKFDGTNWTTYTTANGLVDNYSTAIAVDNAGNVWVGSNSGVSRFNGSTWSAFTTTEGLVDNGVFCIAGDSGGNVWIGTGAGVSKYNAGTWTTYTTVQGLPSDVVKSITVDNNGNKWFGTQMGGFSVYNGTTFLNYSKTMGGTVIDSLVDDNIFAIAVTEDSTSYIGSWYGISVLDKNMNWVKNIRPSDGIYNEFTRDLKFDLGGNLWGGFFADYNLDGGISYLKNNVWTSYSMPEGLVDKQVINLAIDQNNDIWIATGNGVSKLTNPAGISTTEPKQVFSLFPNPTAGSVTIRMKAGAEITTVEILNGSLQVMDVIDWNAAASENLLSLDKYPSGLYFIKIGNSVEKLVITR